MPVTSRNRSRLRRLGVLSALAVMLAACGAEPFEYTEAHDLPAGPGLFSGESGKFEIKRKVPSSGESDPAGESQPADGPAAL